MRFMLIDASVGEPALSGAVFGELVSCATNGVLFSTPMAMMNAKMFCASRVVKVTPGHATSRRHIESR